MSDKDKQNIIGVFDSGLGGLTVFKYLIQTLPQYNYLYLGDTARLPYGEKSPETIYEYAREAMDFLFQAGCRLIIIACNTASAQALRRLQQEYLPVKYPDRRILGVIRPLAESVASQKKLKRVGIIGTKATIASGAYPSEIAKLRPEMEIIQTAAPLLVPLIEEGWAGKPETKMILKKYLRPLKTKDIEALILACTHYPFLYKEIKGVLGRRVLLPQPGEIIVQSLDQYLKRHPELGLEPSPAPSRRYCTTDDTEAFKALGEKFLGQGIKSVELVKISRL